MPSSLAEGAAALTNEIAQNGAGDFSHLPDSFPNVPAHGRSVAMDLVKSERVGRERDSVIVDDARRQRALRQFVAHLLDETSKRV